SAPCGGRRRRSPVPPNRRAPLLPAWDEFLVAYRDRREVAAGLPAGKAEAAYRLLLGPLVVVDGGAVATWRRRGEKDRDVVTVRTFVRLGAAERKALEAAAARYGR